MKTIYLKVSVAEDYEDVHDQLVLEDFMNKPHAQEWTVELVESKLEGPAKTSQEKALKAIEDIQSAYDQAQSSFHNWNDWEKEQWDSVNSALADAKTALISALNSQIEECAKVARTVEVTLTDDDPFGNEQIADSILTLKSK